MLVSALIFNDSNLCLLGFFSPVILARTTFSRFYLRILLLECRSIRANFSYNLLNYLGRILINGYANRPANDSNLEGGDWIMAHRRYDLD
jgi:hypothetical protein